MLMLLQYCDVLLMDCLLWLGWFMQCSVLLFFLMLQLIRKLFLLCMQNLVVLLVMLENVLFILFDCLWQISLEFCLVKLWLILWVVMFSDISGQNMVVLLLKSIVVLFQQVFFMLCLQCIFMYSLWVSGLVLNQFWYSLNIMLLKKCVLFSGEQVLLICLQVLVGQVKWNGVVLLLLVLLFMLMVMMLLLFILQWLLMISGLQLLLQVYLLIFWLLLGLFVLVWVRFFY